MKQIAVFAVLVLLAGALIAQENLPTPPEGYEWVRLQPSRVTFLKPAGWHFKSEQKGTTQVFYLTREDLDTQKQFVVGLTVNVIRPKTPAAAHAATVLDKYLESGESKSAWPVTSGSMSGYGALIRRNSRPPVMVHLLSMANPKTNRVYVMSFEAPEAEWKAAWAIGQPMLETFIIDDED